MKDPVQPPLHVAAGVASGSVSGGAATSRMRSREGLSLLNGQLAAQIEEALERVGDFGEVRLIVAKGRLRFIQVLSSESVNDG